MLLPRSLCAAGHAGTAPAVERRLAFSLFPPARLDIVSLLRSPALQPPSNHSPTQRRCRQNGWSACWAPSAAAVRVASHVCGWPPTACPMAAWRPRYCARLPSTRAATQGLACQARSRGFGCSWPPHYSGQHVCSASLRVHFADQPIHACKAAIFIHSCAHVSEHVQFWEYVHVLCCNEQRARARS